jgi:hypothetical protein
MNALQASQATTSSHQILGRQMMGHECMAGEA